MSTVIAPTSANGVLKSRSPPPSGPLSSPPQTSVRSNKTAEKKISGHGKDPPAKSGYRFVTITAIVFVIAIADVVFVWHTIHASIGGEGDEPHHVGPEAGLHHLHERKRKKQLSDHVRKARGNTQSKGTGGQNNEARTISKTARANPKVPRHIDERIASILKSANVEVDAETASQLPSWEDVVSLYGDKPIIYGLDTCETYRNAVKPEDRMVGPAGIFNTGTNLLFQLVKENCDIKEAQHSMTHKEPKRNGVRWQAPWGKHNPPSTHRGINVAKMWGEGINQTAFFPVVTIKDPYSWMGSQCRHQYATHWEHTRGNCPNLIKKKITDRDETEDVLTRYAKGWVSYESLIDMWNRWYLEYEEQQFPLLRTRFEDLLFHGEEVTRTVCDCVGGVFKKKFKYIEESAKENGMPIHKGANGLVKALLQYGNAEKRLAGLTDRDRWYASKALSSELMTKYSYTAPPLPDK